MNVVLIAGYTPTTGDSFVVLTTGGTETGMFATLGGDGGLFTATYDPMDVKLVAN